MIRARRAYIFRVLVEAGLDELLEGLEASPACVGVAIEDSLPQVLLVLLDQELQEFLSPEDYRGFTRLVSMAQREQTVMSYLDRQQETESEESRP